MNKVSKKEARDVLKLIKNSERIFITGHVRPDSDVISSALALFFAIKKIDEKKKIDICFRDMPPKFLEFLPSFEKIKVVPKIHDEYDLGIILECSDLSRTGGIIDNINRVKIINIDHHYTNHFENIHNSNFLNIIRPCYASCAEIVFDLLLLMNVKIDKNIAICLYSGLVADTGMFQWSNTNEHSFYTAMNLIKYGIDTYKIYKNLYAKKSYNGILLLGKVLSTIKLLKIKNHKVVTIFVTQKMLKSTNTTFQDTEDFINFPMLIDGVSIAIFLKEEKRNSIKVSFRSDSIDVERIVRKWGGGGHKYAAGATLSGNLKEVEKIVIKSIKELL